MEDYMPIPPEPIDHVPMPQDLLAEQAVLGSILLEPTEAMDEACNQLQGNEFTSGANRKIFRAMQELAEEQQAIDVVTLISRLNDKGWLAEVGGPSHIVNLASSVPTAANILHYLELVLKVHTQREAIQMLEISAAEARRTSDPYRLIASTQARMESLSERTTTKKGFRPIRDILPECYEDVERKYSATGEQGRVTGVPSGFSDLDKMTSGFQNSEFVIIGARPSVGKTAFALNIASNAAKETNKTVAVFSLEMSEKQLVNRMICAEGNIDASRFRTAHLEGDEWEKTAMAIGKLSDLNIYIDDTPAITVAEIRSKCRKLKKDNGLCMIIIDYLQLISGRQGVSRQEEVSAISRTLKQLAREMDVPVIALSQLSRGVEQRPNKRPMLSDLRDSGSIEQDGDVIAFLYRDDYYSAESEKKNIIEIIIAKQRNGPVGTVELVFLKNFNKFVSLDRSQMESRGNDIPVKQPSTYRRPDMYGNKTRR